VSQSLKDWDLKLPHVEFAYNRASSYATKHSSFECVHRLNPPTPIDLLPLASKSSVNHDVKIRENKMKRLHK